MPKEKKNQAVQNSSILGGGGNYTGGLLFPLRWDGVEKRSISSQVNQEYLTNDKDLISRLWNKYWITNKIVELPIQDAFKDLPKLQTAQATDEQNEQVLRLFNKKFLPQLLTYFYYVRAYGSAGLVLDTGENRQEVLKTALEPKEIEGNDNITLKPVDFWNMIDYQNIGMGGYIGFQLEAYKGLNDELRYAIGSMRLNKTRVIRMTRNDPDWNTLRFLQIKGGTSIFETIYTTLDKNAIVEALSVELMMEAKVDVLKFKGLTENMLSPHYQQSVDMTVQNKMQSKNFNATLILDSSTTEFEQKQINLSSVPELLNQFQMRLLQASGIPPKRVAGLNTTGLSDTDKTAEEFYNRDLKAIQNWGYKVYLDIINITYINLFGFYPKDLELVFPPLDTPTAETQQLISSQKLDNILKLTQILNIPQDQLVDLLNKEKVFGSEIEATGVTVKLQDFSI